MSGYQSWVRWKKTDGRKVIMWEKRNKVRKYIKEMRKNTGKTYRISHSHTLHMKSPRNNQTQLYTHLFKHTTILWNFCFDHMSEYFIVINFLNLSVCQNTLLNNLCRWSLSWSVTEVKGHTHSRYVGARWRHLLRWKRSLRSHLS